MFYGDHWSFMSLSEIIIERIKNEGPISFRDFMEMSLYYPELGYYTSSGEKIGSKGDFYTSPYFTSIFGEMIARQLEEMWIHLGKQPFSIVEYGAGTGKLCLDILNQLKKNKPLYDDLSYFIIEKSPSMRAKEKSILNEKVTWINSIKDISGINGCILSNELVDNFSVHQVVMDDDLMEVYIDHTDKFTEILKPAGKEIKDYLDQLNVNLPKGFRTEINLEATKWINEVASSLEKGFVLTVDYGCLSSELYHTSRRNGTMVCYNKHKVNDQPYSYIGQQDITTHVNFSALDHWGTKSGLNYCGYTNQVSFLRGLGLVNHIKNLEDQQKSNYTDEKEKLFFIHTLLMDMGHKFKVLIQQKGLQSVQLSGLAFSEFNHINIA